MLDILVIVDEICKKHNIPYWLDYGTLLGAVRHGGFIPWDDDLDVSVMHQDFKRLEEIFARELPEKLAYQDWKNEKKLTLKCAKIRDKNSFFDDGLAEKGGAKYQGIYIDIFPLKQIPSVWIKKKVDFLYGRCFRRLKGVKTGSSDTFMAYLLWPIALFGAFVSNTLGMIKSRALVSNIFGGLNIQVFHPLEDIFPLTEIEFEGKHFPVPKNYDAYLTRIYNNYMEIPAKDKRQIHANGIEFFDEGTRTN